MRTVHEQSALHRKSYGPFVLSYAWSIVLALSAGILLDHFGPLLTLGTILALIFIMIGLKDYKILCAAVAMLLPFAPTFLLSKETTGLSGVKTISGVLTFVFISLFFSCILRPKKIIFPSMSTPFLLYVGILLLAGINGSRFTSQIPGYFQALGIVKDNSITTYLQECVLVPLLIIACGITVALLSANARDPRWVLIPIMTSATLLGLIVCLYALKSGSSLADMAGQDSRRYLSGIGLHANEIGLSMNMAFAISLALFVLAGGLKTRLITGVSCFIILASIFLTFSRGAYLATIVVIAYFIIAKRRFSLAIAAALLVGAGYFLLPNSMLERTTYRNGSNSVDDVSSGRIDEIWLPLIPSIAKSPIIGSGHASILWSDAAKKRKILPVGHPHSAYLAALLDVGIVGSIIIAIFFMHMWFTFWRLAKTVSIPAFRAFFYGASACIPVLLVQGLTDDNFMPSYTHAFLWLAYGVAIGFMARRDRLVHTTSVRMERKK